MSSPCKRLAPQTTSVPHREFFRMIRRTGKPITLVFVALIVLLWSKYCAAAEPVIAAYVFPQGRVLTPGEIDAKRLTRINYAFANIADGRIVEGQPADAANFAALNALKKDNPHLTVLISVGGWLWSGGFTDVALTSASRATFVDSVEAFVTRYSLDGLDVDWEFPGQRGAGHPFRPEDKQNYTLLLKEIRSRFDKMTGKLHRPLYLTTAVGATTDYIEHTEMGEVAKYVDTVNLMAYDYYEPGGEEITGNHAPLFTDPADPRAISADRSVREYEKAGVPADKLVLGVPFYGHVWGQVQAANNGLFQPGKEIPGAYSNYAAITSTMLGQGYTRYWDSPASAPYLYNADKQIFVSYEDPQSLALKCKYVSEQHLKGVMFWDYAGDPSGTLLGVIDQGLKLGDNTHHKAKTQ